MTRLRFGLLAVLLLAGPLGCQSGAPPTQQPPPSASNGVAWPYWPQAMRVHPLTRIMQDPASGQLMIEARIEFTDRDGVTSRSFGDLRLELVDDDAGTMIKAWEIDLRPTDVNKNHFDVVTSTYLFKLSTGGAPLPARGLLRSAYLGENGTSLSAERDIIASIPLSSGDRSGLHGVRRLGQLSPGARAASTGSITVY